MIVKKEHVEYIESAGFQDVRILEEKDFPVDAAHYVIAQTDKQIRNDLSEDLHDIKNVVISIKVSAIKGKK